MAELVCAATDPDWHAHRATGVTATDITAILGLNRHQSAYGLYWVKRGVVQEQPDNDRLALGRALEPYIVDRWLDECCDFRMANGGLYRSSERPWQLATPDRCMTEHATPGMLVSDIPKLPVLRVFEGKSWADADRHAWDDGPPPAVRAQVLWQMDTLGVATGHVAVLWLPSGELSTYVIEHAHEDGWYDLATLEPGPVSCGICKDIVLMRKAGAEFWERVTEERPPSVDGSAATLAVLKQRFPAVMPAQQAEIPYTLWNDFAKSLENAAYHKKAAKEVEAEIREAIGDAAEITVNGEIVGRRSRYPVKEHVRKLSWVDKITRVKNGDDSDASA